MSFEAEHLPVSCTDVGAPQRVLIRDCHVRVSLVAQKGAVPHARRMYHPPAAPRIQPLTSHPFGGGPSLAAASPSRHAPTRPRSSLRAHTISVEPFLLAAIAGRVRAAAAASAGSASNASSRARSSSR
eukprot:3904925-Prymnesium_polylepis.1